MLNTKDIGLTPYWLNFVDDDNICHRIEITGDEFLSTICCECSKEFKLSLEAIIWLFENGDMHGTSCRCPVCQKLKKAKKEKQESTDKQLQAE